MNTVARKQELPRGGSGLAIPPAGYKRTDIGVIPENWAVKQLADVCTRQGIVRGPFGGALRKDIFTDSGFKVYEQRNAIYKSCAIGSYFVDQSKYTEMHRFSVSPGDFIISCSGTIGRIFQIPREALQGIINQALLKLTTDKEVVYDRYFYILFEWNEFQMRIIDSTQGGAMKNLVGMDVFRTTPVVLPPLPEQRAIAEALSDVDKLLGSLEKLIVKKRAIKQAAMQQLLTGKTRLSGFNGEWETTKLGDIADLKNGYAFQSNTYVLSGMYQIITIANVQDGHLSLSKVSRIARLPSDLQDHQQLSSEDILISMTGNVGRVCVVKEVHCLLNQRVGRLVATGIDRLFLYYIVHDRRFLSSMIELAVGGAQDNLGKSDITGYRFFLPRNSVEQRAIATVLSDMDAEIAALERRRDKTRTIKQSMMQQLLTGRVRLVSAREGNDHVS